MRMWSYLLLLLSFTHFAPEAMAKGAQLSAVQVMDKVQRSNQSPFSQASIRMTLVDKKERTRTREFQLATQNHKGTIKFFFKTTEPKELAGTSFLSIGKENGERNSWLYLPASQKTRRIGDAASKQSFFGSDFTYADMEAIQVSAYQLETLKPPNQSDNPYYVIQAIPKDNAEAKRTGYLKSIFYIDSSNFTIHQAAHFMDKKGNKVKILKNLETKKIGSLWIPTKVELSTMVKGTRHHSTILETLEFKASKAKDLSIFNPANLGR